jgi:hypothetical protein
VGEVVQLQPELALRFGAEHFVQLAHFTALRIDAVELVAEQTLELQLLVGERHRCLEDLEDPRLVGEADAALRFGRLPKLFELAPRPLGSDIAWRDHRHEDRHAFQAIDERLGEEVVALELGVAPDVGVLAEQLPDADLEGAMQVRNPTLAPLDQLLVIEMRIADESISVEMHAGVF